MKNIIITHLKSIVTYFFILLFVYAAISKILDFENFQVQIAQSPLLAYFSKSISYLIIIIELIIVIFLIIKHTRLMGLYASLSLMIAFSLYIYLSLNYSDQQPCSCGGILENMGWTEHLIFNIICILIALVAILHYRITNYKKRHAIYSIFLLLPSGIILSILYPLSISKPEPFIRKIAQIMETEQMPLAAKTNYFAGNYGDTLFIGNRKAPLLLTSIGPHFNKTITDTIRLDHYQQPFVNVTINVMYPYFSVYDGKVPAIYEGKLPNLIAYDTGINRLYFSKLLLLSPHQYVFKTMLVKTRESELGLLNSFTKKYSLNKDILQKQADGVFDTDGNMCIDYRNKRIVYSYLYRNEITTSDFGLKMIERKKTIDSLTNTTIETKTLENGQTKLVKSKGESNLKQSISDNKFYNLSKSRGLYESIKEFRNHNIIDVYDSRSKKYLYSYYLKKDKGTKVRDILSTKYHLYILSDYKITRYRYR